MYRTSTSPLNYRQTPSNVDNYKAPSPTVAKSDVDRLSRQSPRFARDEWSENDNRTPSKINRQLMTDHTLTSHRAQSPSAVSLKSMIIDGRWKYRELDDDKLRLKSMGIENLVTICHEILAKTFESTTQTHEKRSKPPLTTRQPWPIVKHEVFEKLTKTDRDSLTRGKMYHLMTIVHEAASTSASRSELVRIWREATEQSLKPRRSKTSHSQPVMSYEKAFQHLLRTPNDRLLQIALHASLINHSQSDLRRIGEKLGINKNQFNVNSIRNSTKDFEKLIQFVREHKLKQKREKQFIDTNKLQCEPKKKRGLYANVSGTKFRLICQALDVSGFYISPDSDFTSNLLWNDTLISMDIVSALKPYQKVNHFPALNEISMKNLLAQNYDRLSHCLPKEYHFAPKTWIFPNEYNLWFSYASNKPKNHSSTYILKPNNAAKSEGIAIHCGYKQIRPMKDYIVQEYIQEPYLINGMKFHLRVYALITSCDPLRVFISKQGLVHLSSKHYEIPNPKNAADLEMHLTNYVTDDDFLSDNERTRSLKFLFDYLKKHNQDKDKLWREIQNMTLKTIFLAAPHLLTAYRTCRPGALPTSESVCFALIGIDILIDKNLKPWIIKVNRCPSFDTNEQVEFDVKMKLLYDTLGLLRFRESDRKKSLAIEKIEAQQRLYTTLGRRQMNQFDQMNQLKESLFLIRREKARENFENHHSGDYIRLFPAIDHNQMSDLMNILIKSFDVLYTKKNNAPWNTKYFTPSDEEELLNHMAQLKQIHGPERSRSSHTSNSNRTSSSASFAFDSSDDEKKSSSKSSPHSDRSKRSPSSHSNSSTKRVSTQTPPNILRSTSASSLHTPKKSSRKLFHTGNVARPQSDTKRRPPGVSANRITEKKAYSTAPSSMESPREHRSHSPKPHKSNDKSQTVNYASIIRATRQQHIANQSTTKISADITKELQLTTKDLHHLYQSILEQMKRLCIHYPHKSDRETYDICNEIVDHWNEYKSAVGRFWLVELDADKRQEVIDIVWKNVQQIVKKVCIMDDLAEQLPLNRHLLRLQRRLLANHGQCLWDTCQDRHTWETLFVKSTNDLSTIELDCCYCFVDVCKQALFVVFRYSADEKLHKQRQNNRQLTVMVKS